MCPVEGAFTVKGREVHTSTTHSGCTFLLQLPREPLNLSTPGTPPTTVSPREGYVFSLATELVDIFPKFADLKKCHKDSSLGSRGSLSVSPCNVSFAKLLSLISGGSRGSGRAPKARQLAGHNVGRGIQRK